jgi:large subunit ribosomal protein L29
MKSGEERKRFRSMDAAELEQTISSAREELMNFRFRRSSGQLPSPAAVKTLRRQIARAETIRKEKAAAKSAQKS